MVNIGVKMRKVVIFTFKGCSRLIYTHPFLLGMLSFLVFLHSSFPFFFSMLVSASPVLVCTAVLLGTLFSYGKPIMPEIVEERMAYDITTLKPRFSRDNVVFERSGVYEKRWDKGEDVVEMLVKEDSLVLNEISMIDNACSSPQLVEEMYWMVKSGEMVQVERERELEDLAFEYQKEHSLIANEICIDNCCRSPQLVEEMSWMVKSGERVQEESERELENLGFECQSEMLEDMYGDRKTLGNQYSLIMDEDDEQLDMENAISPVGSNDSKEVNIDVFNFSPESPWKYANEEEQENHDDEASDLDSGRAERSSPVTSMAGILPMLDELHPLLYEVTPQPANSYRDGSDAAFGVSHGSSTDSEDDSEHHKETEVADDEHDQTHAVKEDQKTSAITWTEADQKNLKDFGTSELEKNQWLENLIARQRARKTMRTMTEKNLIDFDDTDIRFNVPSIWTKRNNPFDLPQDSYENLGSPSIPGSAPPSILLPQRNPFALSYDSSEKKPALEEDHFDQEFVPFQSKVPIFCRHESFNIRPSFFGTNEREMQDMNRFRAYLVSERLASERSHSTFTRQSSELSDSKESYALDKDSIGSAGYLEEPAFIEEDTTQEPEIICTMGDTSELVGHGSESSDCSEDDSMEFGQVTKRHIIVDEIDMKLDVQYHQETNISKQRFANWMGTIPTEIYSKYKALERRDRGTSSSSPLSEESERICIQTEAKEFEGFTEGGNHSEESINSVLSSPQGYNLKITTPLVDDTPQKDPVYDSSPPAFRKHISSLSVSSGPQDELENVLLPIVVKRSVSFSERVTNLGTRDMKSRDVFHEEMLDGAAGMISENSDEMELEVDARMTKQYTTLNILETSIDLSLINSPDEEMREQNNADSDLSDSETTSVPAPDSYHISADANASRNCVRNENIMFQDFSPQLAIRFSNDANAALFMPISSKDQILARSVEELNSSDTHAALSVSMFSNETNLSGYGEKFKSEHMEQVSSGPSNTLPPASQLTDHITEKGAVLSVQELIQPNIGNSFSQYEKVSYPIHQYHMSEEFNLLRDGFLVPVEKTMFQPLHEIHEEPVNSSSDLVEFVNEVSTADNLYNHICPAFEDEVLPDIAIPVSVQHVTVPSEVQFSPPLPVEAYVIKEIDTVGGFSC